MRRVIQLSELKPEKADEYIRLHAEPWPELLELISSCNIHHYSISIRGNTLYTYFEYTGEDYDADMARMDASPVMQRWWTFSKPCFLHHKQEHYYDDLREIFYLA